MNSLLLVGTPSLIPPWCYALFDMLVNSIYHITLEADYSIMTGYKQPARPCIMLKEAPRCLGKTGTAGNHNRNLVDSIRLHSSEVREGSRTPLWHPLSKLRANALPIRGASAQTSLFCLPKFPILYTARSQELNESLASRDQARIPRSICLRAVPMRTCE